MLTYKFNITSCVCVKVSIDFHFYITHKNVSKKALNHTGGKKKNLGLTD